ncbi:MAG TPA: ATP phosphoribosyltransferase regulatory subunit [Candidatus Dormibacteraeota bacterium]|nr:ATP phosphoribosyltransferase regulatory subunit [Candidatus Dormibacteraeota bacterium]
MNPPGAAARPGGFSDWLPGAAASRRALTGALVSTFEAFGFQLIDTPIAEYADTVDRGLGGDAADQLFRFMDSDGRLLALVGERTVSVARTVATQLRRGPFPMRVCYAGPVMRNRALLGGRRREAMQAGCELVGDAGLTADAECIAVAMAALDRAGVPGIQVDVGHAGFLPALLAGAGLDSTGHGAMRNALVARDLVAVEALLAGTPAGAAEHALLLRFPALRGGRELLDQAREGLRAERPLRALNELAELWDLLGSRGLHDRVQLDLGAVRDWDYYTGPTFELFSGDLGFPLGAGGRYDTLLERFGLAQPSTGFVVHVDRCHDAATRRTELRSTAERRRSNGLRIAVPTGVLLDGACALLRDSGVAPELSPDSFERRLQISAGAHEVITVRPTDVPVYVEMGACDCGIVGKDVLWESGRELYEIADLRFGDCRLVLAAPEESPLAAGQWPASLRVATKYPTAARRWFATRGDGAELIQLHGSVELAPSAGLADGIVDLVATGSTLRANRLAEVATIGASTARLVVNVASMKTRSAAITELAGALRRTVEARAG